MNLRVIVNSGTGEPRGKMKSEFKAPSFVSGCIEFRYSENEVAIYANREGLEKLKGYCDDLLRSGSKNAHIHLEDRQVLTENSLNCAIAVFE